MTSQPPRPLWRRILRFGFPQIVVLIAALAWLVIALWPGSDVQGQTRNVARFATVVLTGTAFLIWALFFSGFRRRKVLVTLAALAVAAVAFVEIDWDGNMGAIVRPRGWVQRALGMSREQRLEEHRQQAAPTDKRLADLTERPGDWPAYRGKDRTGGVEGPPIAGDWTKQPPRLAWRQPVGGGYASFSVVNGFLVTIEQRRDREAVVCYDAADGREVWVRDWPERFDEWRGGAGPRATPTVYQGDVYALGATGRLVCIDGKDGSEKWAVETLRGGKNLTWAMSGSPLVFDDLVVVNPGAQTPETEGRAMIAYDRRTGAEVWTSGRHPAGYSSPMLAELSGLRQILIFDGHGLAGHDPSNGAELWRFPWRTPEGINVAQPVVAGGDRVFIASGYGTGGALVRVSRDGEGWKAEQVWRTKPVVMRCKFTSPVKRGDHLYGLNDGILECISLKDGSVKWKDDRRPGKGEAYGHGQILLCGDRIVVLSEYGELALVEATPEEFRELGRVEAIEGDKTWNNPAMAGGRIYVRNAEWMACFDLR